MMNKSFFRPLDYGYFINGAYGEERTKNYTHEGIDLNIAHMQPIIAVFGGIVKDIFIYGSKGQSAIIIEHDLIARPNIPKDENKYYKVKTSYVHSRIIIPDKTDKVTQGEIIALVGGVPGEPGSGNTYNDHLHFGIGLNGYKSGWGMYSNKSDLEWVDPTVSQNTVTSILDPIIKWENPPKDKIFLDAAKRDKFLSKLLQTNFNTIILSKDSAKGTKTGIDLPGSEYINTHDKYMLKNNIEIERDLSCKPWILEELSNNEYYFSVTKENIFLNRYKLPVSDKNKIDTYTFKDFINKKANIVLSHHSIFNKTSFSIDEFINAYGLKNYYNTKLNNTNYFLNISGISMENKEDKQQKWKGYNLVIKYGIDSIWSRELYQDKNIILSENDSNLFLARSTFDRTGIPKSILDEMQEESKLEYIKSFRKESPYDIISTSILSKVFKIGFNNQVTMDNKGNLTFKMDAVPDKIEIYTEGGYKFGFYSYQFKNENIREFGIQKARLYYGSQFNVISAEKYVNMIANNTLPSTINGKPTPKVPHVYTDFERTNIIRSLIYYFQDFLPIVKTPIRNDTIGDFTIESDSLKACNIPKYMIDLLNSKFKKIINDFSNSITVINRKVNTRDFENTTKDELKKILENNDIPIYYRNNKGILTKIYNSSNWKEAFSGLQGFANELNKIINSNIIPLNMLVFIGYEYSTSTGMHTLIKNNSSNTIITSNSEIKENRSREGGCGRPGIDPIAIPNSTPPIETTPPLTFSTTSTDYLDLAISEFGDTDGSIMGDVLESIGEDGGDGRFACVPDLPATLQQATRELISSLGAEEFINTQRLI